MVYGCPRGAFKGRCTRGHNRFSNDRFGSIHVIFGLFGCARPGELNDATIGLGGSSHINMVLFESMTGLKLAPVHDRGGAPATAGLLGGHVPLAFLSSQLVD